MFTYGWVGDNKKSSSQVFHESLSDFVVILDALMNYFVENASKRSDFNDNESSQDCFKTGKTILNLETLRGWEYDALYYSKIATSFKIHPLEMGFPAVNFAETSLTGPFVRKAATNHHQICVVPISVTSDAWSVKCDFPFSGQFRISLTA